MVVRLQAGRRRLGWWRAHAAVLVAALATASGVSRAAAPPLAPVEAGEEPIASWSTPLGALRYVPGRGLQVGDTGLTLGGYTNATLRRDEGSEASFNLEELSLFVIYEPLSRLRFFSELEYDDVFDIDTSGDSESREESATVERLYLDFGLSDAVNLRTGIFLTPVGRWNVIHAAPLVWTTSRPLSTRIPFDPNVTGAMLSGAFFPENGVVTYSLFDQFAGPIEGNPDFDPADHSVGARVQYDAERGWSVGSSYVAARRDGCWRHLGGIDALWSLPPIEVMGEAVADAGEGGAPQWGFYLQPVLAVSERLALVFRYEHFAPAGSPPQVNVLTMGFAFRLLPTVVFKSEYQVVDRSTPVAPAGLRASIAVLL